MSLKDVIADALSDLATKIKNDTLIMDTEEALEFISQIAHVKITKSDVAKYFNVSEKTIDRRELSGAIPPSYKQPVSKKVWFLDEILKHKNLIALD